MNYFEALILVDPEMDKDSEIPLTYEDIVDASNRIDGHINRTPLEVRIQGRPRESARCVFYVLFLKCLEEFAVVGSTWI